LGSNDCDQVTHANALKFRACCLRFILKIAVFGVSSREVFLLHNHAKANWQIMSLEKRDRVLGMSSFLSMVLSALNAGGIKYPRIMLSQPCSSEVNYIA